MIRNRIFIILTVISGITIFFSFAVFASTFRSIEERTIAQRLNRSLSDPSVQWDFVEHGRRAPVLKGEIVVQLKGDETFRRITLARGDTIEQALARFRALPNVLYAEPNYIASAQYIPNDTYYTYQWHLDNSTYGGIHAENAWDVSKGESVVVAVVDTGVAYENYTESYWKKFYQAPDLANTLFVPGYDFVSNDTHPNDDEGHGTHVAGTIAQSTNNTLGVAGISFKANIMPVKVLNSFGNGTYTAIADGIRWAADHGARVINLSLGGSSSSTYLKDAVAYAYNKGVTLIAAAGNSNSSSLLYPAAYNEYVIGVGATRYDETKAPYSNYGSSLDIVAPGGDLDKDQNTDGYGDGVLQQTFGNSYNSWGYYFYEGTSMATPHVSGVAALVIAHGNATTPDEVRQTLQSTADDLGGAGWDPTFGWGLVNAAAALGYTPVPPDYPPTVTITNPANNATVSGTITVTAEASDDHGIDRVEFYVDATLLGSDSSSPYQIVWNTASVPDGSHTVKAVAVDTVAQESSDTNSVLVDNINNPPVADAGPDTTGYVDEPVSFDGSASSDSDGTITSYHWDFGDSNTADGVQVNHTYTSVGTYAVILTVTDNGGLTDQDSLVVTVSEAPQEIEVFYDSFEVSEWNGLWTEDRQNDWFRSTQRAVSGSYAAEVDGWTRDGGITSIAINLQGRQNAAVSFSWFIESGLDTGEYLAFDISTNGGSSWTEKARLQGNVSPEDVWQTVELDVQNISQLKIRFGATISDYTEDANVDVVRVTAW